MIAYAIARRSAPGRVWSLVTTCPYGCRHPHEHGGGSGDVPEAGHRVAHCERAPRLGGYEIVIVDGARSAA
jgi:hypothetical protein